MLRVGMLTSGGDCQALNATMRGVAKTLYNLVDVFTTSNIRKAGLGKGMVAPKSSNLPTARFPLAKRGAFVV